METKMRKFTKLALGALMVAGAATATTAAMTSPAEARVSVGIGFGFPGYGYGYAAPYYGPAYYDPYYYGGYCTTPLEVADPLEGWFGTVSPTSKYLVADGAFLSWFARQSPSTGFGGLYDLGGIFSTYSTACTPA